MMYSLLVYVAEGDVAWVDSGKKKNKLQILARYVHHFNLKCICNLSPAIFEA